jgi:hypothetical protein
MAWIFVRGTACWGFASSVYRLILRVKDLGFASSPINVVVAFKLVLGFPDVAV